MKEEDEDPYTGYEYGKYLKEKEENNDSIKIHKEEGI